jgi:hypothetical protein
VRAPHLPPATLKHALIYCIETWDPPALAAIEERLAGQRFIECTAS